MIRQVGKYVPKRFKEPGKIGEASIHTPGKVLKIKACCRSCFCQSPKVPSQWGLGTYKEPRVSLKNLPKLVRAPSHRKPRIPNAEHWEVLTRIDSLIIQKRSLEGERMVVWP